MKKEREGRSHPCPAASAASPSAAGSRRRCPGAPRFRHGGARRGLCNRCGPGCCSRPPVPLQTPAVPVPGPELLAPASGEPRRSVPLCTAGASMRRRASPSPHPATQRIPPARRIPEPASSIPAHPPSAGTCRPLEKGQNSTRCTSRRILRMLRAPRGRGPQAPGGMAGAAAAPAPPPGPGGAGVPARGAQPRRSLRRSARPGPRGSAAPPGAGRCGRRGRRSQLRRSPGSRGAAAHHGPAGSSPSSAPHLSIPPGGLMPHPPAHPT